MVDLRKIKIRKVKGKVFPKTTFFKVRGLVFSSKRDAMQFKTKIIKQAREERKRTIKRR